MVLEKQEFDKLFSLINNHLGCVEPVDHLVMDESQDTTGELANFIIDVINPKGFSFFFDPRQQIYGFSGANPARIYELANDPEVVVYTLKDNYRNAYGILNFARETLRSLPPLYQDRSHAVRNDMGKVMQINYDPYFIASIIPTKDEFRDWFILCRTNQQVDSIKAYLEEQGIPIDSFKQSELSRAELTEKMKRNTVKVLTIHSAKGLEANNVVVIGARFWNDEEKRVAYVAATRARNFLVWMKGKAGRRKSKNVIKPKMLKW